MNTGRQDFELEKFTMNLLIYKSQILVLLSLSVTNQQLNRGRQSANRVFFTGSFIKQSGMGGSHEGCSFRHSNSQLSYELVLSHPL